METGGRDREETFSVRKLRQSEILPPSASQQPPHTHTHTVLLRPAVQLLLQVDDLDAETLLAVRPQLLRL